MDLPIGRNGLPFGKSDPPFGKKGLYGVYNKVCKRFS
jgi:hypothetical protein